MSHRLQRVTCRKVIVAPFIFQDDQLQFLIVKDRTHKEWTFITGGCKSHESDADSAVRELVEETRNIINIDRAQFDAIKFEFVTTYREPQQRIKDRERGELVMTAYSMFFIDMTLLNAPSPLELRAKFRNTKNLRGAFNENLDITFETLNSFMNKNFVWRFIKQVVVKNPDFIKYHDNLQQKHALYRQQKDVAIC